MFKNRISKYFGAETESNPMREQPTINPSAFVAMPIGAAGPMMPGNMQAPPMNIYEIALADAQRKIAESRAHEFDDLSSWFDDAL